MNQTTSLTRRRGHTGGIFLIAALAFFAATVLARAAIVPLDQRIQGKTYGEWLAHFWTANLATTPFTSLPFSLSPKSSAVLWLWGSSRPTVRTIAIPSDRYLYVGILDLACTTLDSPPFQPPSTNEVDIRACAEGFHETDLYLEIDGVTVPNPEQYHLVSPLFPFDVSVPNAFNLPYPTNAVGIAAGTGVILEPLSPGSHEIRFHGSYPGVYTADVVYKITVYPRPVLSARLLPQPGALELSWPSSNGIGFVLQQSDDRDANAKWSTALTASLKVLGDTTFATVTNAPLRNRFFRLSKPL